MTIRLNINWERVLKSFSAAFEETFSTNKKVNNEGTRVVNLHYKRHFIPNRPTSTAFQFLCELSMAQSPVGAT